MGIVLVVCHVHPEFFLIRQGDDSRGVLGPCEPVFDPLMLGVAGLIHHGGGRKERSMGAPTAEQVAMQRGVEVQRQIKIGLGRDHPKHYDAGVVS